MESKQKKLKVNSNIFIYESDNFFQHVTCVDPELENQRLKFQLK